MAAGYKDFVAGAVLTAADLEDYNQNQSVMRFASAAARDTALSVVKTEGMCAYLIDVNTVTVYSSAAWSTIGPVHGALLTWTPVVVQGATPTLTNNRATYMRIGRWVYAMFTVSVTSAGTAANLVTVSLPVAAAGLTSGYEVLGIGSISDSSAVTDYPGQLVLASSTTAKFYSTTIDTTRSYLGVSVFTAALASADIITGTFAYEASADA